MKELEIQAKKGEKIEVVAKKKQEKEHFLTGSLKVKKGHKVFEIDATTGDVKVAQYKNNTVSLGIEKEPVKLVINSGCIYIPAMNAENAKKKYLMEPNQSAYFIKESEFKLWNQDPESFQRKRRVTI